MLITLTQLQTAAEQNAKTRAAWLEGFEKAVGNPHYRTAYDGGTTPFFAPWLWDIDGIQLDRVPRSEWDVLKAAREYVRQSNVRDYIGEAFGYAD